MKKIALLIIVLFAAGFVYAQQPEIGAQDPQKLGIDSAQKDIKEISVDKFEHDGFWRSTMSSDEGYSTTRLFSSPGPKDKKPIEDEEGLNIPDKYVLGTRIDYLRRGYNSFTIYPTRPIPVEGITKTLSMWVAGRNFKHTISVILQDFYGNTKILKMDGNLAFQGWKKLEVTIPEFDPRNNNGVIQRDYHYNNRMGIKIIGFRIECDPVETFGSYYVYFDDLRAWTDLFTENNRDEDDMVDGW